MGLESILFFPDAAGTAGRDIALISLGLALMSYIARRLVLDKEKVKGLNQRLTDCRTNLKEAVKAKEQKQINKLNEEMMALSMEQMRHNFKPSIITLIPFILVFSWFGSTYGSIGALSNATLTYMAQANVNPADLSVNGTYIETENKIVWTLGSIPAGSAGNVSFTASGNPGLNPEKISLDYVRHDGSKVNSAASSPEVAKDLKIQFLVEESDKEKARYAIGYQNLNSSIVAVLFGFRLGWLGWYFICVTIISMILNKILGY